MKIPTTIDVSMLDRASCDELATRSAADLALRARSGSLVYLGTILVIAASTSYYKRHPVILLAAGILTLGFGALRFAASFRSDRTFFRSALRFSTYGTFLVWGGFCAATTALYGIGWSAMFMLLVTSALSAGATTSLAPDEDLGIRCLLLISVPVFVWDLTHPGPEFIALSIGIGGYILFLIAQLRQNSRAYWREAVATVLQRVKAEETVSQSEAKFRFLFEEAPVGIYLASRDGKLGLVNPGLRKLLGADPSGDLPLTSVKQLCADDRSDLERSLEARGHVTGWKSKWRRTDGTEITVRESVRLRASSNGTHESILGTLEDITEVDNVEQARTRLLDILEATTDYIAITDAKGATQYLNRASRDILGLKEEDASPNAAVWSTGRGDEIPMEERFRIAEAAGAWQGESAVVLRTGECIPVSQVVIAHLPASGRIESYSIISRDISGIREAQEALRVTEEHLNEARKLESVGRLAGGIAHDFNNMLTVILGYSELLSRELSDPNDLSLLAEIKRSAERAADLIRKLLAFSRKQVLRPRVIDMAEAVRSAERMLAPLIGENIRISMKFDPEICRVEADPSQFEQVIVNLALNARDAMPHGGTLTMETSIEELEPGRFDGQTADEEGRYVCLAVRDTGSGMDAQTKARIFEPFFTTKQAGAGTGLGLATVYGFVKQSGGHIQVGTEPGMGTVFTIYLPEAPGVLVSPVVHGAVPPDLGGSETILVVEDERPVRSLLQKTLLSYGYKVVLAGDGGSALSTIQNLTKRPELVISDVIMPVMSGPEFVASLRDLYPDTKVLFISGYHGDVLQGRMTFGPMTEYLRKPFSPDALAQKVRELLNREARDP